MCIRDSPRSGQALYKEIDEFCLSPYVKIPDTKDDEKHEVKVVYPFYQYGEYEKYDPEHANYYLPGSSVKGALLPVSYTHLDVYKRQVNSSQAGISVD